MKRICLLVLCLLVPSLHGMYRRAEEKDLPALLTLIATQAVHDSDKIVIVPEAFRQQSLKKALAQGKLFVAYENNTLIGYKKLFLMRDAAEKKEVLCDELRCCGSDTDNTFSGYIAPSGSFIQGQESIQEEMYTVCIYNGADFTAREFRGKGVNTALTYAALRAIQPEVLAHIAATDARFVTMVYGLTHGNAGNNPGEFPDRTVGISNIFRTFAQSLTVDKNGPLVHARYRAFMPTFDPQSNVLQPLPDDQSVPGFGCVVAYALRQHHA